MRSAVSIQIWYKATSTIPRTSYLFDALSLVQALFGARHALLSIDRWILKVNPVIFGKGRSLFAQKTTPLVLNRLHAKEYGNGVSLIEYKIPPI